MILSVSISVNKVKVLYTMTGNKEIRWPKNFQNSIYSIFIIVRYNIKSKLVTIWHVLQLQIWLHVSLCSTVNVMLWHINHWVMVWKGTCFGSPCPVASVTAENGPSMSLKNIRCISADKCWNTISYSGLSLCSSLARVLLHIIWNNMKSIFKKKV